MANVVFTNFNLNTASSEVTNKLGALILKKTPPLSLGVQDIKYGGIGAANIEEYIDFVNGQPVIPQGARIYESGMTSLSYEYIKVGDAHYRFMSSVTQGGIGISQSIRFNYYENPNAPRTSSCYLGSGSGSSARAFHSICYTDESLQTGHIYVLRSSTLTSGYALYRLEWAYFNGFLSSNINFGENSETGGGEGNFDISTDTIDFPNLPTGSALETGLINMYKCDASDLRGLGEFLWSTDFATNILKVFNDPMEAFVSLNLFPVTPSTASTKETIKFGNLNAVTLIGGGGETVYHKAYPLTSQYVEFDCGTVNINEFFGSALDYNPYTQVQIYLPFIGFQNLSVDDIMDGTITLKYHIDMLTGTCTALIKCVKSNKYNLASVLYSFAGSMNMAVPISAGNYSNALMTLTTGLAGIGIGVATGGTGTAVASAAAGSAMNMLNAKAQVQRSGGIVMNAGALGNLTPYIIITRPVQHKPEDYQKFKGWENNITYTLSSLQGKGYTEIMYTHIEGLTATDEEKAEIEALLKDGVIL